MAVPKSESSGRSSRPAATASRGSKSAADPKKDKAGADPKARAWEDAKKEAYDAQQAARRIPIVRGEPDERKPASRPSQKASAGQANKAHSMADGVPQARSNPLPPAQPRPPTAATAPVGQRNRAHGMADGVPQARSNPLPSSAARYANDAPVGQRDKALSMADGVPQGRSTASTGPKSATMAPKGQRDRAESMADGVPQARPNAPFPASPKSSNEAPLGQRNRALSMADGVPPRLQRSSGQAPAADKSIGERWAELWQIGEARANGFAEGISNLASGAASWVWQTGAAVATYENWKAAGQYLWDANQTFTEEYARNPLLAQHQASKDFVGGLGSAAWDAGQGMVWVGAQVVATGVEAVMVTPRLANAAWYLATGEYAVDFGSKTAWSRANEIVSGYGGAWKQDLQTFGAEQWGMRTGAGGTEKSIFFHGGEVTGFVASTVVPGAGATSKLGVFGRGTAAATASLDEAVRFGATVAQTSAAAPAAVTINLARTSTSVTVNVATTGATAARSGTAAANFAIKSTAAQVDDAATVGVNLATQSTTGARATAPAVKLADETATAYGSAAAQTSATAGASPATASLARTSTSVARAGTRGVNHADEAAAVAKQTRAVEVGGSVVETGSGKVAQAHASTGAARASAAEVRLADKAVGIADEGVGLADGAAGPAPRTGGRIERLRDAHTRFNDRFDRAVQGEKARAKAADELRTALKSLPSEPAAPTLADDATELATKARTWKRGPKDPPGMKEEITATVEYARHAPGRRWIADAIREWRYERKVKNELTELVQQARARALAEAADSSAPRDLLRRAEDSLNARAAEIEGPRLEALKRKAAAQEAEARLEIAELRLKKTPAGNGDPAEIYKLRLEVLERKAAARQAAAEAKWRHVSQDRRGTASFEPANVDELRKRALKAQESAAEAKAAAKLARAEAARNGDLGPVRQLYASAKGTVQACSDIAYREIPRTARIIVDKATDPLSRRIDDFLAAAKDRWGSGVEWTTEFARRHPVLNELRLTGRELFRQGGKHHTLRDEIGRSVRLALNEPRTQAVRVGAQTVVDFASAGVNYASAVAEPLTKPVLQIVSKGLAVTRWGSKKSAKAIPTYLAIEAVRGNVEFTRNDLSVLKRANLSTDSDHARGVGTFTLATTSEALVRASISIFWSGPTVKGFNFAALRRGETDKFVELHQAVPTTFVRPGKDNWWQMASNLSFRAAAAIGGVAWRFGPDMLNINGNAQVSLTTFANAWRAEGGNLIPGEGFIAGIKTYLVGSVPDRWSMDLNFDYPALNILGGFFDGRVTFGAIRPKLFDGWFGGGLDPVLDVEVKGHFRPLGISGVAKKTDEGELVPSVYFGRSLSQSGALVRLNWLHHQDTSYYDMVFSRNPMGLEAAKDFRANPYLSSLYSLQKPWGGPLFKQVEQFDPNDPALPQVLGTGEGAREPRTKEQRLQHELDRAEQTRGPTAPPPRPARRPRTPEERLERMLREAERSPGPWPRARQIALEPPPVVNPGLAGQFAVSPRDGLNVRAAAGRKAEKISTFRHGEFLLQTGPARTDADGTRWLPVVGRDVNRKTVTGFVAEEFVAPHARGDADAKGRTDPDLRRRGYTAVTVRPNDTVRDICRRHGVPEAQIKEIIALNRDRQIVDPDRIYPGDTVYLPPRREA